MDKSSPCPCGLPQSFARCCGRFLETGAYPQDAATLMRSRYSAYVLCRIDYLTKTWHPDTCPTLVINELRQTQWLGLEVIAHRSGLKKATVEFNAYYQGVNGKACLHEVSLFKKQKQRWVYVNGQVDKP